MRRVIEPRVVGSFDYAAVGLREPVCDLERDDLEHRLELREAHLERDDAAHAAQVLAALRP